MVKRLRLLSALLTPLLFVPLYSFAASCSDGVRVSKFLGAPGDCIGGNGQNPIVALIEFFIQYIVGILGLIVVLMIVIGGLQFVLSGGSPDLAKSARDRIKNAATALVLFILMFAILQVLLPSDVRIFR